MRYLNSGDTSVEQFFNRNHFPLDTVVQCTIIRKQERNTLLKVVHVTVRIEEGRLAKWKMAAAVAGFEDLSSFVRSVVDKASIDGKTFRRRRPRGKT